MSGLASLFSSFRLIILAASLLFTCPISIAHDGHEEGNLSREMQARMFIRLWMETCAIHFSNPDKIRAVAKANHFLENPPYANDFLKGEKGTVWDVSLGPHAQNILMLLENGYSCRVYTRHAASQPINDTFEKVMQGINKTGVTVTKISETDTEQKSVKLKQIAYFVSRDGAENGWLFLATTSDSEARSFQAIISVDRAAKPEHKSAK